MKNYLIILTSILLVFGCNNKNNNSNTEKDFRISTGNALLATKVEIRTLLELENEDNPDWVSSFDHKQFVENIFSKVFSGEFTNCWYNFTENDNGLYTIDEIKHRMMATYIYNEITKQKDTVINEPELDLSQIKELAFVEEWNFDKEKMIFEKTINFWTPVRVYFRPGKYKKEDARHKMIFMIKKDKNANPTKKITEDYIYIFEFWHEYFRRKGLDKEEFFKFLLKNIEACKIKTYDPIYLVDKSKREFTKEQLKNYAGISLDLEEFNDEVNKMIFVEDWFFDEKTFNISKKVKGLGFIADRKVNGEWQDKILFFIFFD